MVDTVIWFYHPHIIKPWTLHKQFPLPFTLPPPLIPAEHSNEQWRRALPRQEASNTTISFQPQLKKPSPPHSTQKRNSCGFTSAATLYFISYYQSLLNKSLVYTLSFTSSRTASYLLSIIESQLLLNFSRTSTTTDQKNVDPSSSVQKVHRDSSLTDPSLRHLREKCRRQTKQP